MLFGFSKEGIAGLRKLATDMHKCGDTLQQAVMTLNSEVLALTPMLGNYATPISIFVDDELLQATEIENAITILGERLLVMVQRMEPEINPFNPFLLDEWI